MKQTSDKNHVASAASAARKSTAEKQPDSTHLPYALDDLVYLMDRLRDPVDGCPWDLKQDYASIVPSTIEEAYEVADAIERGDLDDLREELGDLLFQTVFYSRLAKEQNRFTLYDVISDLVAKLVRRHPHVFPDADLRRRFGTMEASTSTQVKQSWEAIKSDERQAKGMPSLLDNVPLNLPSLSRAQKLQKRAAKQGFDWPDAGPVFDKIHEEINEVHEAIATGNQAAIEDEIGDLLFSVVNLSRHKGVDAETALRRASQKFETRFRQIETQSHAEGTSIGQQSAMELEQRWNDVKKQQS